ncbi:MAG: hypothetical protein A3E57_07240 [Candidatus Muproteobacteria bacterium RIFCSPHIGHO2_12_FULL_60_33]|uniref:Uncharacterized protein n=1 Tax=Candidatus Muproteobacteria bacterium RIFCSPLOWO2_01_FULL_60_18 TaxID=1817768 RepID=A0A1F6U2P2_9PROT|nr:MAG: hypothetical protein A2W42_06220 [Candidatus Muproteobacteria bacterium RIFCSPHIGHO2_01_60_12]OGI51654.1 MAG: hypothetical protein A3A87_00245 [Candidatus Muproteobacteria bacterium RIFCSPLOWO2_01_FULL_60_18]OGI54835.1 MAG: hypothetical protein A3D32_01965 [Candidatus Muproteobacteria bacterium RIFCSPHIGHO2_02_FULL_60_13]OGI56452.1 MAG: hypothetical protein A3E57_07240 [Candidatus Muproteobacteria bacterium RIFCSPHIGHO2_12_FULL_60_33]
MLRGFLFGAQGMARLSTAVEAASGLVGADVLVFQPACGMGDVMQQVQALAGSFVFKKPCTPRWAPRIQMLFIIRVPRL